MTATSSERATRSAVRCRVPGLHGGHRRVGHQVHVGPGDAAAVAGQDDGAVHLRHLVQALRAEPGVEQEAARADVEHVGPVADDDQGPLAGLPDPIEALAQGLTRRDERQSGEHRCAGGGGHGGVYRSSARPAVGGSLAASSATTDRGRRPDACPASPIAARRVARARADRRRAGLRTPSPRRDQLDARARRASRAARWPGRTPARAASVSRRSSWRTARTSPPSPTSPQTTTSRRQRSTAEGGDHGAGQGQVGARVATRRPRRRRAQTLGPEHGQVEHRGPSTASSRASRPPSTPCAERRALLPVPAHDEALQLDQQRPLPVEQWEDHRARPPRADGRPGAARWRRARRAGRPAPSRTGRAPSVGPNRCFTARRRRRAWCRSPSKLSTVSTRCSSWRGPARDPSLVTWPMSTTAQSVLRATIDQAQGRLADLGHRAGAAARRSGTDDGLHRVHDDQVRAASLAISAAMAVDSCLAGQPQLRRRGPAAATARARTWPDGLLGADVQRPTPSARSQVASCSARVDLPDPRLAGEQRDGAVGRGPRR